MTYKKRTSKSKRSKSKRRISKKRTNKKKISKSKTNKLKINGKRKRGGCGCGNPQQQPIPLVTGGGDFFLPGYIQPESINGLPLHSFYPENNYNEDPQGSQISSRLINGGKKKGKKLKKSLKKGGNFSNYLSSSIVSGDPISSFGTSAGAGLSNNIVHGYSNENRLGVKNDLASPNLV